MGLTFLAGWALLIAGAPAQSSEPPATGQAGQAGQQSSSEQIRVEGHKRDPNEVRCVVEEEVGSRLNRRRVCRTNAEWAEQRARDRREIERAQTSRKSN